MLEITTFIIYILVVNFTPGPNNIISLMNAGKFGFKKCLRFNLGVSIGVLSIMLLCGFFSSMISDYFPLFETIIKYVGAVYIIYLAYKIIRSEYSENYNSEEKTYGVREGVVMQFVNPKVIIYALTIISIYILPHVKNNMILISFYIGLAAVAFIATCSWALFGSIFHKFLIKRGKIVSIVMASVLLVTAVTLLI